MNPVIKAYLRLCRPPNLPTAAADILAGLAIAGFFKAIFPYSDAILLVLASVFLYAGGVVFNDYFDYELDKIERPERPLPSGLIKPKHACDFGIVLFIIGLILATWVSFLSGIIALVLVFAILVYDSTLKHYAFFGPLNMGICRGLNLFLGMSVFQIFNLWLYTLIPVLFVYAVTLISRGEVHGNNKSNIIWAGVLYVLVCLSVILLNQINRVERLWYILFLAAFVLMVFIPLIKAYTKNQPENIMKAVKAGVLSIILLDAALATAYADWKVGLFMILLLPLSLLLARVFAVT